jgi:CHASE3 domain sensor protein
MTIAKRLILLLAVPLLALLGFSLYMRLQLSRIEERSRFVAENQVGSLAVLGNVSRSLAELLVNVRSHLLANSRVEQAAARAAFEANVQSLIRFLQHYGEALVSDERDRQLYTEYPDFSRLADIAVPGR